MTSQRDASSNVDSDLGATFDFFVFDVKFFSICDLMICSNYIFDRHLHTRIRTRMTTMK